MERSRSDVSGDVAEDVGSVGVPLLTLDPSCVLPPTVALRKQCQRSQALVGNSNSSNSSNSSSDSNSDSSNSHSDSNSDSSSGMNSTSSSISCRDESSGDSAEASVSAAAVPNRMAYVAYRASLLRAGRPPLPPTTSRHSAPLPPTSSSFSSSTTLLPASGVRVSSTNGVQMVTAAGALGAGGASSSSAFVLPEGLLLDVTAQPPPSESLQALLSPPLEALNLVTTRGSFASSYAGSSSSSGGHDDKSRAAHDIDWGSDDDEENDGNEEKGTTAISASDGHLPSPLPSSRSAGDNILENRGIDSNGGNNKHSNKKSIHNSNSTNSTVGFATLDWSLLEAWVSSHFPDAAMVQGAAPDTIVVGSATGSGNDSSSSSSHVNNANSSTTGLTTPTTTTTTPQPPSHLTHLLRQRGGSERVAQAALAWVAHSNGQGFGWEPIGEGAAALLHWVSFCFFVFQWCIRHSPPRFLLVGVSFRVEILDFFFIRMCVFLISHGIFPNEKHSNIDRSCNTAHASLLVDPKLSLWCSYYDMRACACIHSILGASGQSSTRPRVACSQRVRHCSSGSCGSAGSSKYVYNKWRWWW